MAIVLTCEAVKRNHDEEATFRRTMEPLRGVIVNTGSYTRGIFRGTPGHDPFLTRRECGVRSGYHDQGTTCGERLPGWGAFFA